MHGRVSERSGIGIAAVSAASTPLGPVRTLGEVTVKLDFPGGNKPVSGVDAGFSADGHYLAPTVLTVNPVVANPSKAPSYALVWDLRSPSKPPIRVPTGTRGWRSAGTGTPCTPAIR